jgi:hypothetical protein
MSFIYDRLYGKLEIPKLIRNLLNCPGLLRLREIGMPNIKFINFPSFSAVTRYEHSLGACHLADLASKSLGLSEKDRIELMIATLYHDVATPPFAHTWEEVLGFDHEKHLYDLITGRSKDLGGHYAQIFQGKALKLPQFCQSAQARKIEIDLFRVAELILGKKDDVLSSLICGDIDLDNIDNVIRAASAMGIEGANGCLAETLASSFVFYKRETIAISEAVKGHIEKWKRLRETLYNMIYCSIDDFSLQTMLKHALLYLIESTDKETQLCEEDWKLTEEQVLRKIEKHPEARKIYKRMQLRDLYECISLVWIKGPDVLKYIKSEQTERKLKELSEDILHIEVIPNYYLDKRYRDIQRLFVFLNQVSHPHGEPSKETVLLVGFFTPDRTRFLDKNAERRFIDKRRKKEFINKFGENLPDSLSLYDVKIITKARYLQITFGDKIK